MINTKIDSLRFIFIGEKILSEVEGDKFFSLAPPRHNATSFLEVEHEGALIPINRLHYSQFCSFKTTFIRL